jgi:choline dehydrogenase
VAHQKLLRIVAIVSGNIFLGPDLCRREEYLHASIKFTVDVFQAIRALKLCPKPLRPIAQYFIPQLKNIDDHRKKAQKFLVPIIEQRRETMVNGGQRSDDMLQWMLDKWEKEKVQNDTEMAYLQLLLSMAAIHTTTMTATHVYVYFPFRECNGNLIFILFFLTMQ